MCFVECFVSFAASVALERLFPSVRPHVALQMTRRNTSVVALVTLVWLFPRMLPHHVIFQMISCSAGKLTHCASVRLSPGVGSFVPPQIELKQSRIDCTCVVSLQFVS